jgi:hypothetical protein
VGETHGTKMIKIPALKGPDNVLKSADLVLVNPVRVGSLNSMWSAGYHLRLLKVGHFRTGASRPAAKWRKATRIGVRFAASRSHSKRRPYFPLACRRSVSSSMNSRTSLKSR